MARTIDLKSIAVATCYGIGEINIIPLILTQAGPEALWGVVISGTDNIIQFSYAGYDETQISIYNNLSMDDALSLLDASILNPAELSERVLGFLSTCPSIGLYRYNLKERQYYLYEDH